MATYEITIQQRKSGDKKQLRKVRLDSPSSWDAEREIQKVLKYGEKILDVARFCGEPSNSTDKHY